MVAAKQPAPLAAVKTPAEPEEKSSKLTLQVVQIIAILASIPTAIFSIIALNAMFAASTANEKGGLFSVLLIFTGGTVGYIAMARNCKKRIINIQKRLNNQQ